MTKEVVRYEVQDGIATLTLNRPEARNALNAEMLEALMAALERACADERARVIVLTGAGDRAFCAGGDLASFARKTSAPEQYEETARFARLLHRFTQLPKPTLAAVNGHALGGGLGLVLACDLAVAVEHAKFGTPEVHVGLFPLMVMAFLYRHLGPKRTLELALTGEPVPAPVAAQMGIINRAVPADQFWDAVTGLAHKVASFSPTTLRLGRQAFYAMADMDLERALDYLHNVLVLLLSTEDAQKGIRAFLEKRRQ